MRRFKVATDAHWRILAQAIQTSIILAPHPASRQIIGMSVS
jgi:hypothetical protein